ncbi:rhodanese-like domain-containing protein [Mangrovimicrobium sediminis]|uniref:Rhodanese-like domain-containing protein n=1 Tax=Mangrovimicrobium sediminis TaxID=2562682 RepID=A0A4Z0LZC6_9GAMM|nr:rhodanese-like domain-containing protein [Haliea sp. SAOS-164]TGD72621.1 rhodanese-like domain-containing protein [Haliea sp. SAOS-164]
MALFLEFLAQEWILTAALLVTIALFFFHDSRKAGPSLSPQQAINLVNAEQGVFVDLRDKADFSAGHIVDAVHIPASKLLTDSGLLENYRHRPVVLVCKLGQSAGGVSKKLKADGFDKVYKMSGGMTEWHNLQLPVVGKA